MRAILASSPELEETVVDSLRDALGDDTVLVLLASSDELGWLVFPPEAARLLGQINGVSPLDMACAKASREDPAVFKTRRRC